MMKTMKLGAYGCLLWIGWGIGVFAAGDPDQGQLLVESDCGVCHGADGNSEADIYPKLAGQHESYLVKSLMDFQEGPDGPRYDPVMSAQVANLTEQDILDVSAFFAAQTTSQGSANEDLVALGQQIYRGGNIESGVPACSACHGAICEGNEPAAFPKLAGQHAAYIESQLIAFRDGDRTSSPEDIMEDIAHNLTDEEISAVSSYISGLSGSY